MTLAIIDGTIIVGTARGDVPEGAPIPAELASVPIARLRFIPAKGKRAAHLIDVGAEPRRFWIDAQGRLQAEPLDPTWVAVRCAADARTIKDGSSWRLQSEAEFLEQAKRGLLIAVDREADKARGEVSPHLRAIHLAKAIEAWRFLEKPGGADAFPLLAASAAASGQSLDGEARRVLAAAQEAARSDAKIEAVRLRAKAAIRAATNIEEARAARAALTLEA